MSEMKNSGNAVDMSGVNKLSDRTYQAIQKRAARNSSSMAFRMMAQSFRELLGYFFLAALIVTIVCCLFTRSKVAQDALRLADGKTIHREIQLIEMDQNTESPGFFAEAVSMIRHFPDETMQIVVNAPDGKTYQAACPIHDEMNLWRWLIGALAFTAFIRTAGGFIRRRRLEKKLLRPVQDITDLTAALSSSGISDRIDPNIVSNEFKALVEVINEMLDRIETSYNSEKQFVSDASHELRTPIAVIQGYADMLKRWGKQDPAILDEGIEAILQEAAGMKDLVSDLLFLARHDKKTLMLEMELIDPCEVAEEVCKDAELITPEDTFVLSPKVHCEMTADRNMIKQILRILVDNAVKYSPKGSTITVGVETDGNNCIMSVRDHGIGIQAEELTKIFDRFYRADKARSAEIEGHGLGLSIARIIVSSHGGKIRVRSKPNEGSTFYVTIPIVSEDTGEKVVELEKESISEGNDA